MPLKMPRPKTEIPISVDDVFGVCVLTPTIVRNIIFADRVIMMCIR